MLDYARRDATRLRARLGRTDQRKLDEYLTAVRELEQQIAAATGSGMVCDTGARPPSLVHLYDARDACTIELPC